MSEELAELREQVHKRSVELTKALEENVRLRQDLARTDSERNRDLRARNDQLWQDLLLIDRGYREVLERWRKVSPLPDFLSEEVAP